MSRRAERRAARRAGNNVVDMTGDLHMGGDLVGEPIAGNNEPHGRQLGRKRQDANQGMPLVTAARAEAMGWAGQPTGGMVRKFHNSTQTPFGQAHAGPGEVPPEGTPAGLLPRVEGSIIELVSASRAIARTSHEWTDLINNGTVVAPPYDPWLLVAAVEESDSLPYQITAMATNMTGFGWELVPLFPTRDEVTGQPVDPPPEAVQEKEELELFMGACNLELGLLGLLHCTDVDIETTGNGYFEVLRSRTRKIGALEQLQSFTMRLGRLSHPMIVEVPFRHPSTGKLVVLQRYQRFRTFVQIIEQKTVYFKGFGDPRTVNRRTGEYKPAGESWGLDEAGNALDGTEVVHRLIYSPHSSYGVPRWVGAMPHVKSGREAAELVLSWFVGAPIGAKIAMVSGGTWNSDTYDEALDTIDDMARGAENAWSLIKLEADATEGDLIDDTRTVAPRMALEDLTYELPKELYQGEDNLIDGMGRRTGRMFRLPPIYWGGSDDFSRASSNTARSTAEEQVFVPERRVRWHQWFNVQLLPRMGINLWAVRFKGANTDDGDAASGLAGFVAGGGVSPNMLIRLFNEVSGQEAPPIAEPWADRPMKLNEILVKAGLNPNLPLEELFSSVAADNDNKPGDVPAFEDDEDEDEDEGEDEEPARKGAHPAPMKKKKKKKIEARKLNMGSLAANLAALQHDLEADVDADPDWRG